MTKQHEQQLQANPTADTDEEAGNKDEETQFTNPSGILGVNPHYGKNNEITSSALDGLGIKMTPARNPRNSDGGSEIFTPMSEATTYSDSGRVPIGITSMRKLLPSEGNQQDRISLGAFAVQRLDY